MRRRAAGFCILLLLLLAGCEKKPMAAGFYTPSVTVDGAPGESFSDLIYCDGTTFFISAQGLATLLPDVSLSHFGSGIAYLSVEAGGVTTLYNSLSSDYSGGDMGVLPIVEGAVWYIPFDGVPYGFLCRLELSDDGTALAVTGYDAALVEAGEAASGVDGMLTLTGDAQYDRTYLRDFFPVEKDGFTLVCARDGSVLFGPVEGKLRDEGGCYRQQLPSGLVGLLSLSGRELFAPEYLDIRGLPSSGLLLFHAQNGKYGLGRTSGETVYPCELDSVGGYMNVGRFVYPNGSEQGVLEGTLPDLVLEYGDGGLVARSGGLWGALSYDGEVLVPFAYDALFPAPFGDRPGWYGRSGTDYELLMSLPSSTVPVLSDAEQAALNGATLVLLQRQGEQCRVADIATGSAYALPRQVADRIFGEAPLFTLATVQLYGKSLSPSGYPTPAYAIAPVLTVSESSGVDGTVLSYPAVLLSRLFNAGGAIGITDYRLNAIAVEEQGGVYFILKLDCDVKPQKGAAAWGEPNEQGWVMGGELTVTVFIGVGDTGTQQICAVRQRDELWYASPFSGGPSEEPQPPEGPWRYTPETREDVYSAMLEGWVEERVFYEDDEYTWIAARRLEEGSYHTSIQRLAAGAEEKQYICELPESCGQPAFVAAAEDGLFVTTWNNVFASSGSPGPMGLLTEDGFAPLLQDAVLLGGRGMRAYLLGGDEVYEFNIANRALRALCQAPPSYGNSLELPHLQSITSETLYVAWPVSHGLIPGYEVYRISASSGEAVRVYP
ncbi:MAG TPA: hypothetical protein VN446_09165 [Candidatus Acidoferrum sp.]|nr:hypothetical protein [Candidatus Acidoferrum sp.]